MKIDEFGLSLIWNQYFDQRSCCTLRITNKTDTHDIISYIKQIIHECNHHSGIDVWICLHGHKIKRCYVNPGGGLLEAATSLFLNIADPESLYKEYYEKEHEKRKFDF